MCIYREVWIKTLNSRHLAVPHNLPQNLCNIHTMTCLYIFNMQQFFTKTVLTPQNLIFCHSKVTDNSDPRSWWHSYSALLSPSSFDHYYSGHQPLGHGPVRESFGTVREDWASVWNWWLRKSSIEASLWLPGDFFLFTFGDLGHVATAPPMTVGLRLTASCVFCLSRSVIPWPWNSNVCVGSSSFTSAQTQRALW